MTETLSPVLGEATIEELRQTIRGAIVTPEDEGYDEARAVWNGLHDERPALVVQPTGAADVAAAVGFARSHDLPIAVRGGGHSIAGFSTCDDGIVIDLSKMRGVRVDPCRAACVHRRRCGVGRRRPRDPGARARDHGRPGLDHRRRRLHARRRDRLADAQARPRVRQPRRRRPRHRRRPDRARVRVRERRALLGPPRRRRQLRDRHAVRARAPSGRTDRLCGADLLPGGGCRDATAPLPRLVGRRTRRRHRLRRP